MKAGVAHRTVNTILLLAILAIQGANRSPESGIAEHLIALGIYGGLLVAILYALWNAPEYIDAVREYAEGT